MDMACTYLSNVVKHSYPTSVLVCSVVKVWCEGSRDPYSSVDVHLLIPLNELANHFTVSHIICKKYIHACIQFSEKDFGLHNKRK